MNHNAKHTNMRQHITFSLLWLVAAVSSMAQEVFTEGDFSFLPTSETTVSVAGCTLGEGALAIIPETVSSYTVTAIAPQAFAGSKVAAVCLPSTITEIGEEAFLNCGATFINLPASATTIGKRAFYNCAALGHIDLPDGLERIEEGTFSQTSIYTLGNTHLQNISHIGDWAFAGTSLQHFPMTDAVTYLGTGAFNNCSSLQDINLSANIQSLSDSLFAGCSALAHVQLPSGITSIGHRTFAGSGLSDINLSLYQGSIGIMAFNDCYGLPRLTLPADNPHCYTSEDGKALYGRQDGELLSVLPTVERLVIPYPATGVVEGNYPLTGLFAQLEELELPHTWKADLGDFQVSTLKKLTMRMPTNSYANLNPPTGLPSYPFNNGDPCHFFVFNYVTDALSRNSKWKSFLTTVRDPETGQYYYANLHTIERPTEQLYMAEVLPMYEGHKYTEEDLSIVWNPDWNAALERSFPQYYTTEDIGTTHYNYKSDFRNYMVSQYITPEHFEDFTSPDDAFIQCIDGKLRLSSYFNEYDYTNWYLHTNFIPATSYVPAGTFSSPLSGNTSTTCQTLEANPEWGLPVSEYGLFEGDTETRAIKFLFALHMVPNVSYNIYAVVPPCHPLSTEETTYKNKLRAIFYSITELPSKIGNTRSDTYDITYESGKADTILLFQGVQAITDVHNVLEMESMAKSSDIKNNGYSHAIPLIGILCEPQTELDWYDALDGIKKEHVTIVRRFDLQGRHLTSPQPGINILLMSDGSIRKVLIR